MPKNTLGDMHNLLMEQMERLASADEDEIENEIKRGSSMASLGGVVTKNAAMILRMAEYRDVSGTDPTNMLGSGE